MKMWEYVVRRLLFLIPVLIGVTLLTFTISHVIPADVARAYAGQKATPEVIAGIKAELHLNEPLWKQYFYYMNDLIHGNWGKSFMENRPVIDALKQYFPATIELSVVAMLIAFPLGTYLGVISGIKRNKPIDHATRLFAIIGYSIPIFWLALVLQYFLAYQTGLLPLDARLDVGMASPTHITGMYVIDSILTGNLNTLGCSLKHLILPSVCLAYASLALMLRMTRSSMLEVLGMDYIRTARAKGLSEHDIIYKHALRNALIPTVTVAGLSFGALLGGAVLTETIFNWPGMGRFAVQAVQNLDFNSIMAFTILIAVIYVSANLIVDLLYGILDPRVRLG